MIQSTALVVLCLLAAGCYQTNGAFNPDAQACSSEDDCNGDICDQGVCVQCTATDTSRCTGNTPICSMAEKKCQPCSSHDQCTGGENPSGVCTPLGSCAMVAEVAYVDSSGTDNADCSLARPCTKVSSALATDRAYVIFKGTTAENVILDAKTNLSFLAFPGAKLRGVAGLPVVELRNASKLTVMDLEITEGLGSNGHGVSLSGSGNSLVLRRARLVKNGGAGVNAPSGNVEIFQSSILQNTGIGVTTDNATVKITQSSFLDNQDGGLAIRNSTFEVTNNIFARNGRLISTRGGVVFDSISTTANKFEFNTVTQNQGATNIFSGVQCSGIGVPLPMSNSIVYGNTQNGNSEPDQVGGSASCTWTYSLIGPKALPTGTGLLAADPQFEGAEDFRLKPMSPARNAADPAATVLVDLNGDSRPVGGRADLGAIEAR
jgi:Right handed beta helix region